MTVGRHGRRADVTRRERGRGSRLKKANRHSEQLFRRVAERNPYGRRAVGYGSDRRGKRVVNEDEVLERNTS